MALVDRPVRLSRYTMCAEAFGSTCDMRMKEMASSMVISLLLM